MQAAAWQAKLGIVDTLAAAEGEQVGDGEPDAVVALEVAELVRHHRLELGGGHELDERGVDDDHGLAAGDGSELGDFATHAEKSDASTPQRQRNV